MIVRLVLSVCVLLSWLCLAAPASAAPLSLAVSIPPQAYILERLAGERVKVILLVKPGQEPHNFAPTPRQMAELASAKAWFTLGFPFEKRLAAKVRRAQPELALLPMDRGIARRRLETHHHQDEEHGHKDAQAVAEKKDDHGHHKDDHQGEPDPHVWLSPGNFARMAANACRDLARLDPAGAKTYRRNLTGLADDLGKLRARLAKVLSGLAGREMLVYHPAFGYLADEFGIKQRAVEIEGKSPTARQLAGLIQTARRESIKVIFVQPQFPRSSAQRLAKAIGGAVVPLDPLAKDFPANLDLMAREIKKALMGNKAK